MSFEEQIQQWINIDNQMKILNDKIKEMREQKILLSSQIIGYAKNKNMMNRMITLNDSKLKFVSSNIHSPITFKYLDKSLKELIKDPTQANKIINYIKENRELKLIEEIKRIPNK